MKSFFTILLLAGVFITGCSTNSSEYISTPSDRLHFTLDKLDPEIEQILTEISPDTIYHIIDKLISFETRHTLADTESETTGIGAARNWIKSEMERYSQDSGGRLIVEFDSYIQEASNRIPENVEIVNVVATLPGTNPDDDRVYVVSGHYDSRVTDVMDAESFAPGANDDASGTAAVMEMARVMSHYEFDATLVFMAVAGEEQGLFGATHWAQTAAENNINVVGMITNDIIGSPVADDGTRHENLVRIFSQGIPPQAELSREILAHIRTGGENDLPTRQLARNIKEVGESYMPEMHVWMIYRIDRYLRGGDHIPFLAENFPAVRFSEPNENFDHQHQDVRVEDGKQYGDLIEFIDKDYIANVTRVNASALANLAKSPPKPANVGMDISQLTNNTTLIWQSMENDNLSGYEIVWRETSSPLWQWKTFVGDVNEFTIEGYNKDNYLFGVRSVSKGGHTSPAVYPMPVRR